MVVCDAGDDRLYGGSEDDTLYNDSGDNIHNGGSRFDQCSNIVGTHVAVNCET
ncbi:MAG: hypothetical protein ACREAI_00590 [Nitrososphaera sp.]